MRLARETYVELIIFELFEWFFGASDLRVSEQAVYVLLRCICSSTPQRILALYFVLNKSESVLPGDSAKDS